MRYIPPLRFYDSIKGRWGEKKSKHHDDKKSGDLKG